MSAVAGRRTYTEDELQAALRDIQSGKLGTRRAAVIYGIPRSTLRNKVYKLALERERETHLSTTAASVAASAALKLDDPEEEAMDDDRELSGAEEEKEVEKALRAPLLSMADIIRFSSLDGGPEALKALLQRSAKESGDLWTGLEAGKVAPYLQGLVLASQSALVAPRHQSDTPPPPPGLPPSALANSAVPDFMKHLMAAGVEDAGLLKMHPSNGDRLLMRPSPSNSVITKVEKSRSESDMETEESTSSVILKIPSFRPTGKGEPACGGSAAAAFRPGSADLASPLPAPAPCSPPAKDVRDAIAHSISQKFQQALEPPANARRPSVLEMEFKRGGFTPPAALKAQQEPPRASYHHHHHHHQSQQQQQQQHQSQGGGKAQQGAGGGSGGTTGGKGTRPKRGKYRNYDRDSLVEAVRAVQRGEMSVHRAGSYYGVPHSTLEYKVKERHLMRPRKRDPKPNPVDEKIASLKQSELRSAACGADKSPVSAAAAAAAAANKPLVAALKPGGQGGQGGKYPGGANGIKLPLFEPLPGYSPGPPPPFPFWPPHGFPPLPLEYAPRQPPEYFASQMMQRLQEDAAARPLPKTARRMAESLLQDGPAGNGSFLDGIIRSSLESGVPSGGAGAGGGGGGCGGGMGGGGGGADSPPAREERDTAPENMSNKALLDQLCRNSRLTPLSRTAPAADAGSPGEDSYKGSSPLNFSTGPSSAEDKTSPLAFDSRDATSSELPTIELSNDSSESADRKRDEEQKPTPPPQQHQQQPPTVGRIYLKQELAKPENLKPEMLVRFREALPLRDPDENGIGETTGSASDD